MDGSNLLQGLGVFVCVGGIILVALIAFAVRAMTRGRAQQNQTMWNNRGDETPRYDSPDVQSTGGFGGVPNTGRGADVFDEEGNRSGFGGTTSGGTTSGGMGRSQPQQPTRRRDRADDDDVRSSGGFGK